MQSWLKRLFSWIHEAKLFWLTLIILIPCLAFLPNFTEPRIRLIGLVLQLSGIFTVFIGISSFADLTIRCSQRL